MAKRSAANALPGSDGAQSSDQIVLSSEGELPVRKQRKLVRNDTNRQVSKKMWDHFRDFTDVQKFVLTYEGLTLEETLTRDTRSNKAGKGPTMGSEYYKVLRKRFALQSAPSAQLVASDPTQEIRPALREAYKAFKSRPANRTPLLQFFKNQPYLNNRESVGLGKAILEHNPSKTADQRLFILSGMNWFRENDLANKVSPQSSLILVFGPYCV